MLVGGNSRDVTLYSITLLVQSSAEPSLLLLLLLLLFLTYLDFHTGPCMLFFFVHYAQIFCVSQCTNNTVLSC